MEGDGEDQQKARQGQQGLLQEEGAELCEQCIGYAFQHCHSLVVQGRHYMRQNKPTAASHLGTPRGDKFGRV